MFRDAAVLDRQRTATTFDEAIRRYAAQGEKWYDGTVDSVDRRLAVCERLRHSVRATVARLSINDSRRYLQAAETLDADRRVLTALRDDLLTGAYNREDVTGPPGWKTSAQPPVAGSNSFSIGPSKGPVAGSNKFAKPPRKKKAPAASSEQPGAMTSPPIGGARMAHWFDKAEEAGHHLPEGGPHPHGYSSVHDYVQARNLHDWINRSRDMTPGGGDEPVESHHEDDLGAAEHKRNREKALESKESRLDGGDRRWVTLESARFVAANRDTLDDSHELAVRAHHHAVLKTSTFTSARSAAVCEAFVAEVGDLGRQSYRPAPVRTAAVYQDFDDSAMYVL